MFFAGGRGRGPENEAAYALLFSRSSSVNDMGSLDSCFRATAITDTYWLGCLNNNRVRGKSFLCYERLLFVQAWQLESSSPPDSVSSFAPRHLMTRLVVGMYHNQGHGPVTFWALRLALFLLMRKATPQIRTLEGAGIAHRRELYIFGFRQSLEQVK